uniref:Uncharacterized protein n=1 Tax=Plectus sambesii TaxID=2011161 RepID=A0A914WXL4_9BILA
MMQVFIPLLNTGVGYLPNNLLKWYIDNGWERTPSFLQTIFDISYIGIFLISLNPLCDALMILLIMPPYRKAVSKLAANIVKNVKSILEKRKAEIAVAPAQQSWNNWR